MKRLSAGSMKRLVGWVLLFAAIGGIYWAIKASGCLDIFTNVEKLRLLVEKAGPWGWAVFFLLQFAQVIIAPIPGNVLTAVGAVLFGFSKAAIISVAAVLIGSVAVFGLTRRFGRPFVERFINKNILDKYDQVIQPRQNLLLAVMFLLPFLPDDALCMIAALVGINWRSFLIILVLTRPWGLLASAFVGSGMIVLPYWGWAIVIGICLALYYLAYRYGTLLEEKVLQFAKKRFG